MIPRRTARLTLIRLALGATVSRMRRRLYPKFQRSTAGPVGTDARLPTRMYRHGLYARMLLRMRVRPPIGSAEYPASPLRRFPFAKNAARTRKKLARRFLNQSKKKFEGAYPFRLSKLQPCYLRAGARRIVLITNKFILVCTRKLSQPCAQLSVASCGQRAGMLFGMGCAVCVRLRWVSALPAGLSRSVCGWFSAWFIPIAFR